MDVGGSSVRERPASRPFPIAGFSASRFVAFGETALPEQTPRLVRIRSFLCRSSL
jgi:hypothetical protein